MPFRAPSFNATYVNNASYALAVGSACGLAYGLKKAANAGPPAIQRLGAKPWAIP